MECFIIGKEQTRSEYFKTSMNIIYYFAENENMMKLFAHHRSLIFFTMNYYLVKSAEQMIYLGTF